MADLLSLVKELNSLTFKELSEKVIKDSEVEWCLSELQDMLEADCVPVVRCRDCKYRFRNNGHDKNGCPITDADIWMDDNSFCSFGERRVEDATD